MREGGFKWPTIQKQEEGGMDGRGSDVCGYLVMEGAGEGHAEKVGDEEGVDDIGG